MAHYVLAIDETGGFMTSPFDNQKWIKSFSCGVCFIDKTEEDIKNIFVKLYNDFNGCSPNTNDLKSILRNEAFHSNKLSEDKLIKCKDAFAPIIDKAFSSKDKPSLYANNQDWWLTSVVVVIELFLDSYKFQSNDTIDIFFDGRKDTTWGALDENTSPYDPNNDQQWDIYKQYHKFLKDQIWNYISPIMTHRGLNIKLYYGQDSNNAGIAVADIVTKLVARGLSKKQFIEGIPVETRSCRQINNLNSPEKLFENDQIIEAYTTILHELENDDNKHIGMVSTILNKLNQQEEDYAIVWSLFYDFIKNRIEERKLESSQQLVEIFTGELKKILPEWSNKVKGLKELNCTDFIILINEYSSHLGIATSMPFSFDEFEKYNNKYEGRLLRRWENKIRFNLRAAEICFNGYDFKTIQESMSDLCDKQDKLREMLDGEKDNHSSAILGTLGQAYAFLNETSNAESKFKRSLEISDSKKGQTYSYIFTICHKIGDVEKCKEYFRLSTGIEASDYLSKLEEDRSRNFNLVSYEKLRALEIKKNGRTDLPRFDIENHSDLGNEYPIPLIKKWVAISLYLENKEENKGLIMSLLNESAESCIKGKGIAIRAMAIPMFQCISLIGSTNSQYEKFINDLANECPGFAEYAEAVPNIKTLDNKLDIWDRALLLPFYYA
ncbi:MAG: hypothetical protein U0K66_05275 [Paludibacteraceae bacterium]|jgi:hypothetical protein|nr:hypothetical protein [Paludibacteraceae bacterium]